MMMKNNKNGGQPSGRRLRKDVDGPIDHGFFDLFQKIKPGNGSPRGFRFFEVTRDLLPVRLIPSLLLRKCSGEAFFARGLKVLCKKIIKSEGVWTCLSIFL